MDSPADVERPLRIPVLLGTVRKGRMSERVAHLMEDELSQIDDVTTELVDIAQLDVGFDDAAQTHPARLRPDVARGPHAVGDGPGVTSRIHVIGKGS